METNSVVLIEVILCIIEDSQGSKKSSASMISNADFATRFFMNLGSLFVFARMLHGRHGASI